MYALKNGIIFSNQNEITQTEAFVDVIKKNKTVNIKSAARIIHSYKFILNVRNHLHLISPSKSDRLEFSAQEKIANRLEYSHDGWHEFMKDYFMPQVF